MVRWVGRYTAASSPMGGADDDSGDDGPSQVDGGDNDYIMK
jgi:hypothetical protein